MGLHTQCFGPSEPYTAIVYAEATDVPANSSLLETVPAADAALGAVAANATPTVAVAPTLLIPPLWATSATGGGAITLMNAPAGTAIWGAAFTPFGQTSLRYMPVSRQPLATPSGWAMAISPAVEPTPPNTLASTYLGWTDQPNGVTAYYSTGQGVCDDRRARINWVPLVFNLTPGYTDRGNCKDSNNNQMGFPAQAFSCPTGYGLSADKLSCTRSGTPVYKPKDGVCAYIVSSGTFFPDTTDLDCPSVNPTIATSCSASGGSDPVVRLNGNGTVTLTQYYGGCGTSKSKTCTTTSTNAPGYYQPALIGPVTCS